MESIVNKANNKVRIEMEGRLTTVGLELLRVTTLQENTFAELAECKSHIKDLLEVIPRNLNFSFSASMIYNLYDLGPRSIA